MVVEYEFRLLGHKNYYKTVLNTAYVPQFGTLVKIYENEKEIKGYVREITYCPDFDRVYVVVK